MVLVRKWSLERKFKKANDYAQWQLSAKAYDHTSGLDHWRQTEQSREYDYVSIRTRLDRLRSLKAQQDYQGLLYILNEGIHGNTAGMGRASLYSRAKSGTKHLVEDYIDEIVDALELLVTEGSGDISAEEKRDFFDRASHCFGHTALMLSGSGSLLFFHVGVIKALVEADLLPTVLSGASGGAIVGSVVSTHSDKELSALLNAEYFLDKLGTINPRVGISRARDIEDSIAKFIPDLTFQQAFKHSGRAMNISVAPAETHQTSRLLNATTSPSVLIRSAVMASAAVPGIYPPVTLQALGSKGERKPYLPSRKWVDGSVSDDMPAKRLARLYGVNHYIVSQTNPFVLPFVTDSHRKSSVFGILQHASRRSSREWFNAAMLIVDRIDKGNGMPTRATSIMRSLINQEYMGDINILPDSRVINPFSLLSFPKQKAMQKLIDSGERSTWPKLEMIKQQTRISRTLRSILQGYEVRPVI
jgi:TAG lipase/steryl ester hydrolase/phospholipase A2/LPA acyltransferase